MASDVFSRGRYATDASIYQMFPIGVVVPKSNDDVLSALSIAREEGVCVLPRGGGTSQCGQTVNRALVVDVSKHLTGIEAFDAQARSATVQPGLVLDELNRFLKPHGLWFPVDVSTSSRATIGGMAANNSCGSRSIRYGTMRDNVEAIEAVLADGSEHRFETVSPDTKLPPLFEDLLSLGRAEADEIRARFPDLMRRVGGYNIDALIPSNAGNNLSHLLVGSEGTLAYSRNVSLRLSALPTHRVLGVCHFPSFHAAMDNTRHLVELGPTAVELVDRTMIELARDIDVLGPSVDEFVCGEPQAILLVEFAEASVDANLKRLHELESLMADLGFDWRNEPSRWGGVVPISDPALQAGVWDVRKEGLNILMSMRGEGKPVSFVEDCAVRLEDLADYTARLTEIFTRHGTQGTWYAHASVGTLHVRPVLNLKLDSDVATMRSIAEETFEMVKAYRGSHSGEHGDGIVRSEFHRQMFGERLVRAFETVKHRLDPLQMLNPNRIVHAPRMDDRSLMRYPAHYRVPPFETELDWSAWSGSGGGFQGAVEMCNNNGACRKSMGGVMCPSFRVTRDERDLVRGRANSLRLAISGQLGDDALASDDMARSMALCVSCKACRRECPTGVDMARMKIEVAAARARRHGLSLHERLVGYLPRYASTVSRYGALANARNWIPGLAGLSQVMLGFSRHRPLPRWSREPFSDDDSESPERATKEVVLWADTFNRYFEPENVRAARALFTGAGYSVVSARPPKGERPLCCGRTFLAVGLVEQARQEARRSIQALLPLIEQGQTIVGLEPSCLLTLRDEWLAMLPQQWTQREASAVKLFDEFIVAEFDAGRFSASFKTDDQDVVLHGHCHRKAFGAQASLKRVLTEIAGCEVRDTGATCCGMAGAFGYNKDTYSVSKQMAEMDLLPTVRDAPTQSLIVADGTSCRHQIADGTPREAVHPVRLLASRLVAE